MKQIEIGADIVHSVRSYDIALIRHFDSLTDMQAYAVRPFHQAVLKEILNAASTTVTANFESSTKQTTPQGKHSGDCERPV